MLNMIYPENCTGCGINTSAPFRYFCWECLNETPKIEAPFCRLCGDPVFGLVQHDYVCFNCSREKPFFDAARSAVRYDGVIAGALRDLKYHSALWMVSDLALLIYMCVQAEFFAQKFDVVTAVPLHAARYRARGFNQSAELGRALARRMQLPFRAGLLRRIRSTGTQTGLTAPQRTDNVCGAFKTGIRARVKGRRILLVDDVMTTGATVNACAKALKRNGAALVCVITVARG
ncbi:MAG: ComF family protein [Kiritimatiellales bacterium]